VSSTDSTDLPPLDLLHDRHNVSEAVVRANAEAASVVLSRHHQSSSLLETWTWNTGMRTKHRLAWPNPSPVAVSTWANLDDAVEAGAYAIALAAVEVEYDLYCAGRAVRRSGCDWWIGPANSWRGADGQLDLESAVRLEVSGIEVCRSEQQLGSRLTMKVDQLANASQFPGKAAVVGFSSLQVVFRDL
jgi:hypothetical protein